MKNFNIENNINETKPSLFEKGLNALKKGSFYALLPLTLLQYSCGDDHEIIAQGKYRKGNVYKDVTVTANRDGSELILEKDNKTYTLEGPAFEYDGNTISFKIGDYKVTQIEINKKRFKTKRINDDDHIVHKIYLDEKTLKANSILKELNSNREFFKFPYK